jgi:hypothetical protein
MTISPYSVALFMRGSNGLSHGDSPPYVPEKSRRSPGGGGKLLDFSGT